MALSAMGCVAPATWTTKLVRPPSTTPPATRKMPLRSNRRAAAGVAAGSMKVVGSVCVRTWAAAGAVAARIAEAGGGEQDGAHGGGTIM